MFDDCITTFFFAESTIFDSSSIGAGWSISWFQSSRPLPWEIREEKRWKRGFRVHDKLVTGCGHHVRTCCNRHLCSSFHPAWRLSSRRSHWRWHTNARQPFIIFNALAFICSLLATISLLYSGVASRDISIRNRFHELSRLLLHSSVRSLVAAFAMGMHVVLAPVAPKLAMLVGFWSAVLPCYLEIRASHGSLFRQTHYVLGVELWQQALRWYQSLQ